MPMFPLRLPDTVLDDVDDWIQEEGVKMSRSEAIRRLLAIALATTRRGGKR
jgi:metal-responsive CopG/Arc/MetJ family transcriptional regulator